MIELSQDETQMVAAARRAAEHAYAPYSKFSVGAAVRSESGELSVGANVENASYGATLCAERAAIAAMVVAGGRKIISVAVYTDTETATPPCGICRQVIAEFGEGATVLLATPRAVQRYGMAELLPLVFRLTDAKTP